MHKIQEESNKNQHLGTKQAAEGEKEDGKEEERALQTAQAPQFTTALLLIRAHVLTRERGSPIHSASCWRLTGSRCATDSDQQRPQRSWQSDTERVWMHLSE